MRLWQRVSCGALIAVALTACAASRPKAKVAPGGAKDQRQWPKDDRSLCGWKGHPELEASESVGPGAIRPNIRRVYKSVGEGAARHSVLVCREIDTNLDGIKDVVRFFNAKGEPIREEEDSSYDGNIDVWITFANGRIAEEDIDTKHTGHPDVWKYYVDGKLSRIRRSVNCPNGKPDTWEIYVDGHLDRMGTDVSCDGHVDYWERDAERVAAEAKKAAAEEAKAEAARAAESGGSSDGGAPAADGGAPGQKGK